MNYINWNIFIFSWNLDLLFKKNFSQPAKRNIQTLSSDYLYSQGKI